jgi:isopenicillin-N epimerase
MDFYLRQLEEELSQARQKVASFVGTTKENIVFVDNATYAMNVVATSFRLKPADEVLINDHEYGAVHKIWQRACERAGAKLVCATLPEYFESDEQIIETLTSCVTDKTRLLIVSHITSATALIMPAKKICEEFSSRDIPVCVDGPHAPAQIELNLDDLDCDFYTASLHKWTCGTLGTGFLYVHPRQQSSIEPAIKSWGRLKPAIPESWDEEFTWMGTRDPSHLLSLPTAIEFLESIGLDAFRARSRWLATYAEEKLIEMFGTTPIGKRNDGWYGSMTHVPMPPGDWSKLQKQLWDQVGIEVMIINFNDRWFIRVSNHLYNNSTQLDTLTKALHRLTNQ